MSIQRHRKVAELVQSGKTNEQIAAMLNRQLGMNKTPPPDGARLWTPETVKSYRRGAGL